MKLTYRNNQEMNVFVNIDTFQSTTICVLPMFHIYGLNAVGFGMLYYGGKIITLPKFDPQQFSEALLKYKVRPVYQIKTLASLQVH